VKAIAVTGASGLLGQKVVEILSADDSVGRVVAIGTGSDRVADQVEYHQIGLEDEGLEKYLGGCEMIVHLGFGVLDHEVEVFNKLLEAAGFAGCSHLVVVSSASVYGARPDNPIPLSECSPVDPPADMELAVVKAEVERMAQKWAKQGGVRIAVLRPVITLGPGGISDPTEFQLREATMIRAGLADPPVQFLHLDDLASAVALTASNSLEGVYNVAPDRWIEPELFDDLVAEQSYRFVNSMKHQLMRVVTHFAPRDSIQSHLATYGLHPWVVANDRLRSAGWEPIHTSEEVYVSSSPLPWWRKLGHRRRQEVALAGAVGLGAGIVAAVVFVVRRLLQNR